MFDDQDDKTEDPTPRKLREAEEKGQVAQSPEFAAAIQAVASAAVISLSGPLALRSLGEGMERTFRAPFGAGIVGNPGAAAEVLQGGFTAAGKIMLPILAALAFFGPTPLSPPRGGEHHPRIILGFGARGPHLGKL